MELTASEAEDRMRRILIVYTASFFVWGGALTAFFAIAPFSSELEAPQLSRIAIGAVLTLLLGGWLVWTVQLVRYLGLSMRINRDPALKAALNDERRKQVTGRAMAVGFWAIVAAAGLYILIESRGLLTVSGVTLAVATIWIGCTLVLGAFLVFDRDDTE
ncbi:MAG: hypothetical protein AAFV51_05950 [Pseudomonadota bacterium]